MPAGSKVAPPAQSSRIVSALVEGAWHIGRHAQRVLRFVEARCRVRVRADAQSERAEKSVDALSGEMRGALELHVLDEVRQPPLVVVFQN